MNAYLIPESSMTFILLSSGLLAILSRRFSSYGMRCCTWARHGDSRNKRVLFAKPIYMSSLVAANLAPLLIPGAGRHPLSRPSQSTHTARYRDLSYRRATLGRFPVPKRWPTIASSVLQRCLQRGCLDICNRPADARPRAVENLSSIK